MKPLITFLVLLVSAISLAFAENPIKIGVICPLSGPAASFGQAMKNGIELALSELDKSKYLVIYEDDEFLPAKTVTAFHKLTGVNKVDFVIVGASAPSNAIAPIAESNRVPILAWASDRKVSSGRKFAIRSYVSGEREGEQIAKRALKLNYDRIGLFYSDFDYPPSVRAGVVATLPKERILMDEILNDQIRDFKPFILRAKQKKLESVFLCLSPGQAGVFAKQSRELNLGARFFGCENLHNVDDSKVADGALEGAWFATAGIDPKFRARYIEKFGNEDAISGASIHYDLMKLLDKVLSPGLKAEEVVSKILTSGEQTGATGNYRFRDADGDKFMDFDLVIKRIVGTSFVID